MACHDACFYVTLISPDKASERTDLLVVLLLSTHTVDQIQVQHWGNHQWGGQ